MYTVYLDRDNTFTVQLKAGPVGSEVAVDLASVTKMEIYYLGSYYSSEDYASSFDWSEGDGKVTFKLGVIPSFPAGRDKKAELIVYDPSNPEGIVWTYLDIKAIDIDA